MNHDELKYLINKLQNVSLQLESEIRELQALQNIREASRNTGRRNANDTSAHRTDTRSQAPNGHKGAARGNKSTPRRLKVGDRVRVERGRNEGATATIVRETATQFELESEQVVGKFRKWKTNVRKIKNDTTK